jgi:hypothetical protein
MRLRFLALRSDISGRSGLTIPDAILSGERNTAVLASLPDPRVKSSVETLGHALEGDYRSEHLFTPGQRRVTRRRRLSPILRAIRDMRYRGLPG